MCSHSIIDRSTSWSSNETTITISATDHRQAKQSNSSIERCRMAIWVDAPCVHSGTLGFPTIWNPTMNDVPFIRHQRHELVKMSYGCPGCRPRDSSPVKACFPEAKNAGACDSPILWAITSRTTTRDNHDYVLALRTIALKPWIL